MVIVRTLKSTTILLSVVVAICSSMAAPMRAYAQVPQNSDATQIESSGEEYSPTSFVDSILEDATRRVGFSVGVFRVYSSDKTDLAVNAAPSIVRFTTYQPRVFTQFRGRTSRVRLDYGFGYRVFDRGLNLKDTEHSASVQFDHTGQKSAFQMNYSYGLTNYTNRPSMDSSGHNASIQFHRRLSAKLSLQMSDMASRFRYSDAFSSSINVEGFSPNSFGLSVDPSALAFANALRTFLANFSQNIYLVNQRVTTNTAAVNLAYRWSERASVTFTSRHEYQDYETPTYDDLHAVQAGFGGTYKIKPWLFFDTSYSTYLSTNREREQTATIQRLQAGGFRHQTRSGLELSASGGVEYSRYEGSNLAVASFQGGITKATGRHVLSVLYHRGFSRVNGPGTIVAGNDVSASLTSWLSRRVTVSAGSTYIRGSSAGNVSSLDSLSGSGNISVALHSHLLLSAQGSYMSQSGANAFASVDNVRRYAISAGMQYFVNPLQR